MASDAEATEQARWTPPPDGTPLPDGNLDVAQPATANPGTTAAPPPSLSEEQLHD